jgi:hypothetical protein
MLIGHKPVCAFWRRPPKGAWLTNTSQGGSMDYNDVPKSVLDLAVKVSKAARAEYWACDIAYGKDKKVRILECATAFAAFPYIRDWIGQYIMWSLSKGRFRKPHIPMFNWEELGKIDSSLLRTMRHIAFGEYSKSFDGAYFGKKKKNFGKKTEYIHKLDSRYKMFDVKNRIYEEWPSEKWNYQDRFPLKSIKSMKVQKQNSVDGAVSADEAMPVLAPSNKDLKAILTQANGIGNKKVNKILDMFNKVELVEILNQNPTLLLNVKGINNKTLKEISKVWSKFIKNKNSN